jgi:hypothetical protein
VEGVLESLELAGTFEKLIWCVIGVPHGSIRGPSAQAPCTSTIRLGGRRRMGTSTYLIRRRPRSREAARAVRALGVASPRTLAFAKMGRSRAERGQPTRCPTADRVRTVTPCPQLTTSQPVNRPLRHEPPTRRRGRPRAGRHHTGAEPWRSASSSAAWPGHRWHGP